MLEVYRYAALQTASHYEASDYLATEHALIDDTGMTRARIFRSRTRVLTATWRRSLGSGGRLPPAPTR